MREILRERASRAARARAAASAARAADRRVAAVQRRRTRARSVPRACRSAVMRRRAARRTRAIAAGASARCARDARAGASRGRGAARGFASACTHWRARAPRNSAAHLLAAAPRGRRATSVAAAVGVGARTSATKSQIVKSVSWPTPDTTGSADSNTARATGLLVERPQVLDRAAAARDDQHIDLGALVGDADRARDLGCGLRALHGRRIDHDAQRGPAARERGRARRAAQRRAAT